MGRLVQPVVVTMPRFHQGAEHLVYHKPTFEDIIADAIFEAKQRSKYRSARQRSVLQPLSCMRMFRPTTTAVRTTWIQVLDMSGFRPSDIKIKINGDSLIIHGRTETKQGENVDLVERKRVVPIPDKVERSQIKCHINQQGHFIIRGTLNRNTRDTRDTGHESTKSVDIVTGNEEHQLDTSTEQACDNGYDNYDVIEDNRHTPVTENDREDSKPSGEYIVTEAADERDDESDKKSVASFADFIVDCLTNEVNQSNGGDRSGSGSPVPSDDFVVLDNSNNDGDTVAVDTVSEAVCEGDEKNGHHTDMESSKVAVKDGNRSFSVKLDLKDYPTDKIRVQCKDSTLFVDAEREWKDGDMLRSQTVHRMYQLPQNAEKSEARAFVDEDGLFSVTVPVLEKKSEEAVDIAVVKE